MNGKAIHLTLAQQQELIRLVKQELKQKELFFRMNNNPVMKSEWQNKIDLLQGCLTKLL